MSLISEMSNITTIPTSTLKRFYEKEQLCIEHKFFENELNGEPVTYIDLNFGMLYIQHIGDELQYKFIPSKSLEKSLIEISNTHESPLINVVEDTLKNKIMNVYKDLF